MRKWMIVALLSIMCLGISQIFAAEKRPSPAKPLQSLTLFIDGKEVKNAPSAPSAIHYDGTIYVPLQLIGNALQKPVGIDSATSTVWLGERPAKPGKTTLPAVPSLAAQGSSASQPTKTTPPPVAEKPVEKATLFGISLGMSDRQVIATLGEPARKEPSQTGYDWWIYNRDYSRYVQVGILNGKVVDIYSNSVSATIGDVKVGTSYESLARKIQLEKIVSFSYQNAKVQITNQPQERPLALLYNTPVIYYLDKHAQSSVTGLRMMDQLVLLRGGYYETKWTYQGTAPDFNPPRLSIKDQEIISFAHERQVLDLVNAIRHRHKLAPLTAHVEAARVAREHSRDMEMNNYFSHVSATTGFDPFQRLKQANIHYKMAGENIAAGYPDAIEATEGWMNSPGHRKNILEKGFTQLGVGVYLDFYTQAFLTQK